MLKVNVDKLDKMAIHGAEDDPDRKVTGNFALYSAVGTKSGAAVYFELEPGKELGAQNQTLANTTRGSGTDAGAGQDEISLMHVANFARDPSIHDVMISVNGSQQPLSDVERVTYYLHPSFQPNIVTRYSSEDNFAL